MLIKMCGKVSTYSLLVEIKNDTATVKISVVFPQKDETIYLKIKI